MTKFTNFMKAIADDMYERYHSENVETEEDFDSMENIDFKHEVIDSAISSEYTGDVEEVISEFGIGKAIVITLGAGIEFEGMNPRQISATLLYQIVMEKLDEFFIYEDYLVYKSENKHYCDVPDHENEVLLHDGSGGFYCEECEEEKSYKDEEDYTCHHCGMLPAPFFREGQRRCEEHNKDLC